MSSEFGNCLKISIFGQSHGEQIGVVIDGLMPSEAIDENELMRFMNRRRGGQNPFSTPRAESDIPHFISGILNGVTCASPVCAVIDNNNTRSSDYSAFTDNPRPGHADLTAFQKWGGKADMRGGGHFSGRLTAPLCVAGGIAKQILARRGIFVGAHLLEVAGIRDSKFPPVPDNPLFTDIALKSFPVIDDRRGDAMKLAILAAASESDSVGGIIECSAVGLPPGLGSPMFDGIESRISSAVFAVPAVKGIEFGSGFGAAKLRGSQNNDPISVKDGKIITETNNSGGILGGISNGMPLNFSVVIKPTPSIGAAQSTVSLSTMQPAELKIKGRHDPCIAQRAVPVIEAVTAIVILDLLMEGK